MKHNVIRLDEQREAYRQRLVAEFQREQQQPPELPGDRAQEDKPCVGAEWPPREHGLGSTLRALALAPIMLAILWVAGWRRG